MSKKLVLMLATAATLALAAPALAQAATGLTEAKALVAKGKKIVATNIGLITVTSSKLGNLSMKGWTYTAEVTANSLTTFAAAGVAGKSSSTGCTSGSGAACVVTNITLSSLHTTGGGSLTSVFSFSVDVGPLVCSFSTPSGMGTYNPAETAEGGDIVTFNEVPLNVTPAGCGTTAKFDGKFSLETDESMSQVYLM